MITLTNDKITKNDIHELCLWLSREERLTYGTLVEKFEKQFAEYVGSQHAVFVNSGSSANLLAVYAAKLKGVERVIVPALCWATDAAPVYQFGMDLKFVDVNLQNLSVDLEQVENILKDDVKTAILVVDVLGLQPDFTELLNIASEHNCMIIEDACESLGSTYYGKHLGTFGDIGTYSFYYGHHITTIEGGMIVTDNYDLYKILKSIRSHGWARDWDAKESKIQSVINKVDDFNNAFTFYYPGFNVRPTEINAFLGLQQLSRFDSASKIRYRNYLTYVDRLNNKCWTPSTINDNDNIVSNFGMPFLAKNNEQRKNIIEGLKYNKVECRPLISGNVVNHPVNKYYRSNAVCPVADDIHQFGMYLPNHEDITTDNVHFICDIIESNLGA